MIPGGDSEGAGSHRDCILGIQAFHIKDDGAMVNQIVCQRSINGGGLNSQGLTVRFHGIDFQHGLGTAIVISGSLQSSHNSSGITGLAIGEGHAVTDVELPGQLVNLLPGVSQPGDQLQVGADAGQGFANAQTVGFPACLTTIADGNAQAMALDNGEVDLTFQMPTENVRQFIGNDQFVINKITGSRSQMVYFNLENKFLSDINVRKAISMAVDREALANIVNKGDSEAATAMFPASFSFGKVPGIACDLEGAKKLLADAGYTDSDGDGILDQDGQSMSFR